MPESDELPRLDTGTPHIARIYDYWLGGKDNFEADRKAAELALAATPTIVPGVRANRRFRGRAVRYMATEGSAEVTSFFDGLDLIDPGVVPVQDWRLESDLDRSSLPTAMWGGVARKP